MKHILLLIFTSSLMACSPPPPKAVCDRLDPGNATCLDMMKEMKEKHPGVYNTLSRCVTESDHGVEHHCINPDAKKLMGELESAPSGAPPADAH